MTKKPEADADKADTAMPAESTATAAPTDGAAKAASAAGQPQIKMQILGQYIRDMSFENMVAQKGVHGEVKPEIQVQVGLDAKKRPVDNQYEVILKLKVTSNNKDTSDTLFLLEMEYGGIFHIEGVPNEQLHPFLMIECPRMLFPFARRIVADVTHDGGFPQLNLENFDFVQLYRNTLAQRAAQNAAAEAPVN